MAARPGMDFSKLIDEQDVIVENQRGLTLFGHPCFSPKLLFPRMDPTNFQILNREKGTFYNMKGSRRPIRDFYPLSGDDQGGRWLVDMRYGDVDDQGWVYSWAFRHGRWRGTRGVVRRRLWVRARRQEDRTGLVHHQDDPKERSQKVTEANTEEAALTTTLKNQLLDRHKFEILEKYDKAMFQDPEVYKNVQQCFQYASSKRKFEEWLKQG